MQVLLANPRVLRQRFPRMIGPRKDDICYATQNRQDAVKALTGRCDLMLVVGSANSSNSNRLREIAEKAGIPAYRIDGPQELRADWLADHKRIGVTAGASAPGMLVQRVVQRLREWGVGKIEEAASRPEGVAFSLPLSLRHP